MHMSERMESAYELTASPKLMRHTPIIIRLDVSKSPRVIKKLQALDNSLFFDALVDVAKKLASRFDCILGYVCSDEISLLKLDFCNIENTAVYCGDVQTYCSLTASAASSYLTRSLISSISKEDSVKSQSDAASKVGACMASMDDILGANFLLTSRVFNIPLNEVNYYLQGRQSLHTFEVLSRLAKNCNYDITSSSISQAIAALKGKGIDWENTDICHSPHGELVYGVRVSSKASEKSNTGTSADHSGYKIVSNAAPVFWSNPEFVADIIAAEVEAHDASSIYKI